MAKEKTKAQYQQEITRIEGKMKEINIIRAGAGMAGGIAGLTFAVVKKKKFWTRVGFYILGGMIVGSATYMLLEPKKQRLRTERDVLREKMKDAK